MKPRFAVATKVRKAKLSDGYSLKDILILKQQVKTLTAKLGEKNGHPDAS